MSTDEITRHLATRRDAYREIRADIDSTVESMLLVYGNQPTSEYERGRLHALDCVAANIDARIRALEQLIVARVFQRELEA